MNKYVPYDIWKLNHIDYSHFMILFSLHDMIIAHIPCQHLYKYH